MRSFFKPCVAWRKLDMAFFAYFSESYSTYLKMLHSVEVDIFSKQILFTVFLNPFFINLVQQPTFLELKVKNWPCVAWHVSRDELFWKFYFSKQTSLVTLNGYLKLVESFRNTLIMVSLHTNTIFGQKTVKLPHFSANILNILHF